MGISIKRIIGAMIMAHTSGKNKAARKYSPSFRSHRDFWLAELADAGLTVSVVNPAQIKAFLSSTP